MLSIPDVEPCCSRQARTNLPRDPWIKSYAPGDHPLPSDTGASTIAVCDTTNAVAARRV